MLFSWTLSCLLAAATVNLAQGGISDILNKCNSSTAYLEVADQMVKIAKTKTCSSDKCSNIYLEVAELMIDEAKTRCSQNKTCDSKPCDCKPCDPKPEPKPCDSKPMDCSDVLQAGHNRSGVYKVWPRSRVMANGSLDVYCDMDTDGGGWTVIQRRGNYSQPKDYFYRDWESYKKGFGNVSEDFWLGNDAIHALSSQRRTSIRFDLEDVQGKRRYALYDDFWIDDEWNSYRLHVSKYSGDAGDSFASGHDKETFSTKDRDNEESCAQNHKGGWWYYEKCYHSNLNGLYQPGNYTGAKANRVAWQTFRGYWEGLKTTEIKLRGA